MEELEIKHKINEDLRIKRELQKQEKDKEIEFMQQDLIQKQTIEEHKRKEKEEKLNEDRKKEVEFKEAKRREKVNLLESKIQAMEDGKIKRSNSFFVVVFV